MAPRKDADPRNARVAKQLADAAKRRRQEETSAARAKSMFRGFQAAIRLLRGRR